MAILNFTPLQIGLVGVNPSLWFLQTELSNAQIQVSGALASANPHPNAGDFVLAGASDGPEYYVVTTNNTLLPAGGSVPTNFNYENTWFMAKNGNDSNDGKSVNTPKQTLQGCQAEFTPLVRNVINILDSALYEDVAFLHESGDLVINAPGAKFQTTENGPPLFWQQGGNLFLNVNEIANSFSDSATILINEGLFSLNCYKAASSGGRNVLYANGGSVLIDAQYFGGNAAIATDVRIFTRYLAGGTITTSIGEDSGNLYVHAADSTMSFDGSGTVTGLAGDTLYGITPP